MFKKLNTPISENIIWYKKIIIWCTNFSLGIIICSYLIGSFQKFLEEILTHNFLGRPIEVGLKLFLICTLEMVVKTL